jgi:hypothetical protein
MNLKDTTPTRYSSCYTYDLPIIEYNYIVPENCTEIIIEMVGGGSSASFDGKEIKGGGSGGEIRIELVKPTTNDVINVKLGLGGKFQIVKDGEICNSESGQDSEIQINGKTIAIARGSYNGKGGTCEIVHKDDDIHVSCTLGKESTSSVRAISSGRNYLYFDDNVDGHWGDGGLGKKYNNGGVYLGAGGHGYITLWVNTFTYTCMNCKGLPYVGYPKFTTLELLQSHHQQMHNTVE